MYLGHGLAGLVVGCLVATDALGWPAEEPPAAKARILKQFADEFVRLKPGTFRMGSNSADAPRSEKPAVEMTLRTGFDLAKYEVTQELYEAVMGKNPARWKGRRNSVEKVSWDEANAFCRGATAALRDAKLLDGQTVVRLASEAEWEYACRAGTTTRYGFGDAVADLRQFAWYEGNSKGEDPPVGRKKANAWGLYDMHGYVWEWCADAWSPSHEGAATDGSARRPRNENDRERVMRGGAYNSTADQCRSAYRAHQARDFRGDTVGLRCVRATRSKE